METTLKQVKKKVDQVLGSGTVDKVQGQAKTLTGQTKTRLGEWIGDAPLRSQGQRQQAEGEVQHAVGEIKELAGKVAKSADRTTERISNEADQVRAKAGVIVEEARLRTRDLADEATRKLSGVVRQVGEAIGRAKN